MENIKKRNSMRRTSVEVSNRQIGWIVAVVIVISLGSFSVGYFWGEKKAADRFVKRVEQDALSDQVFSSICSLYENEPELDSRSENDAAESAVEEPASQASNSKFATESEHVEPNAIYYAQLVGFGTSKKAKQFVEKLAKKGITVHMRERVGKTGRGRRICWYQVVTEPYTNKDELIGLVEQVRQNERIHDVRIVTI